MNERDLIIKTLTEYFEDKQEILFVYLFGSFANGSENPMSDIDIAIYYEQDEATKNIDNHLNMRIELMELFKREIDLVVLNGAKPFLKSRIINNRIRILSRDSLVESEFVCRSLGEYFDIEPYMEIQYQKAMEQMKEGITHHEN